MESAFPGQSQRTAVSQLQSSNLAQTSPAGLLLSETASAYIMSYPSATVAPC
jgi:hypothetical protein